MPRHPSPELAPILDRVPVGDEIPEAPCRTVAGKVSAGYVDDEN